MTGLDRRHFLSAAIASMGITALYGSRLQGFAQGTASAKPARIDIHHHFGPPVWVDAVRGRPLLQPANTTWTVAKSLEDMDRGSVAASVISITNPGLWFGDKAVTSRIARGCNEYAAKVVSDHPSRFGFFAAMPLPDVDTTLKEIAHRFPNIRWIWSHAGGTMPFLAGRIDGASRNSRDQMPDGLIPELKKFYYDLAGAADVGAVASLQKLVNADKILFGTDFPPGGSSESVAQAIRALNMFSESDLRAIDRDNAVRLLPRLKSS